MGETTVVEHVKLHQCHVYDCCPWFSCVMSEVTYTVFCQQYYRHVWQTP